MPFYGGLADTQRVADLLVAATLRRSVPAPAIPERSTRSGAGAEARLFEIEGGMYFNPECTVRMALARSSLRHGLQQIGLGAGLQRAVNILVAIVSGKHDEA